MADTLNAAARRLSQAKSLLTGTTQDPNSLPWNPNSTNFPSISDLPTIPGAPKEAAWVWGKDDYRGRLNLLTPTRIKAAASEIRTGASARLDLPLHYPDPPAFDRQPFKHEIKTLAEGIAYDDIYTLNTQSGTQWDGFRHVAHISTATFYNNTKSTDFSNESGTDNLKCSIHHWSASGFSGRGVLLDYKSYCDANGISFDCSTHHEVSHAELVACGKWQGLDIRPESQGGDIKVGDIVLFRFGWTEQYLKRSKEENAKIALRSHSLEPDSETVFAGLKQEKEMVNWLHDCYFAAVGGDVPSLEAWPSRQGFYLHEYLLALWGMPLGEMLDLEKVSEIAKKEKRYTFFFVSAPANCHGGVSSHVNGTAIF